MATTTVPPPPSPSSAPPPAPVSSRLRPRAGTGRRRFRSGLASVLIVLSFVLVVIPLVFVVLYIAQQGLKAISMNFLTSDIAFSSRSTEGGIGPAIVGTIVITLGATLMAVPLGVLGGIFLN